MFFNKSMYDYMKICISYCIKYVYHTVWNIQYNRVERNVYIILCIIYILYNLGCIHIIVSNSYIILYIIILCKYMYIILNKNYLLNFPGIMAMLINVVKPSRKNSLKCANSSDTLLSDSDVLHIAMTLNLITKTPRWETPQIT